MGVFGFVVLALLSVLIACLATWLIKNIVDGIVLLYGAPFVASADDQVEKMVKLAKIRKREKVVDLGSGDGRLLIALAQSGWEADGIEINPFLVWFSRRKIKNLDLKDKIDIYRKNFWNVDFSKYDVVMVYAIQHVMQNLEKKLRKELKPGSRVISNYFQFPHWEPTYTDGNIRLYVKDDV